MDIDYCINEINEINMMVDQLGYFTSSWSGDIDLVKDDGRSHRYVRNVFLIKSEIQIIL